MSETLNRCKACGGRLGPVFYEARNVPVHSCLMLNSEEEALAFHRGNVRLAPCIDCGTITNLDFDKRWSAYAPEYEDQQAFSPTFSSFAGKLARDLVERHKLQGETVIDIGCSKGDFLALVCNTGAKHGIGIDPSVLEGRVTPPSSGKLDFITAYYAEEHTEIKAKLISNRHTLEHVHDVHDMLTRMHRHAVKADDAIVFIEVPSMTRVLKENAFEDIYYEHCSYFTPGTLARALRKAGFGVTRLWLDYDDQYLLAEASTDPRHDQSFEIEEPVSELLEMIETFKTKVAQEKLAWGKTLDKANHANQKIAIWGSGSKCIAFWHAIDAARDVERIVDINPNRWSKYPPSLPLGISKPSELVAYQPDIVIVMNPIYINEIERDLASMGVAAEVIALGARAGTNEPKH